MGLGPGEEECPPRGTVVQREAFLEEQGRAPTKCMGPSDWKVVLTCLGFLLGAEAHGDSWGIRHLA